jgi:ABC-type glycerol-3-phosphate transport system substrate-binding protein
MNGLRLTAAALLTALLTTTAMAQTELRITHATTGGSEKQVLDRIIADFEAANPDIKVVQIPYDDDIYSDTGLITQLQGTVVPDIYFQWAGFPVQRDAQAGYAMDLTEALATDGWKDTFLPSVWTEGAGTLYQGRPYMIPTSLDVTNTIWYNQAIFEENGLTPPATWDELIAVVEKLNAAGEIPIIQQRALALRQLGLAHCRQGRAAGGICRGLLADGQVLDAGFRTRPRLHRPAAAGGRLQPRHAGPGCRPRHGDVPPG